MIFQQSETCVQDYGIKGQTLQVTDIYKECRMNYTRLGGNHVVPVCDNDQVRIEFYLIWSICINPLSPNSANINFLLTILIHNQEERL